MIHRRLYIGSWVCDFYFCPDGYDSKALLKALAYIGTPRAQMRRAQRLMESGQPNSGFTYSDSSSHRIISAIGPTTSGSEFIDSFVHELRHAVNDIATALGYRLDAEVPSYVAGDAARDLAEIVCDLGCSHCHSAE